MKLLTCINRRGISAAWIDVNLKFFTTFINLNRWLNIYTRRCMRIVQYYRYSQVVSNHIELVVFLVVVAFAICHVHRNVHSIFCFPSSFSMLSSSSSRRRMNFFILFLCSPYNNRVLYSALCCFICCNFCGFLLKKKETTFFVKFLHVTKKNTKRENEYGEIHRFLSSTFLPFSLCNFPFCTYAKYNN